MICQKPMLLSHGKMFFFYCCYFISNHSDEYEFTFPGLDIGTVDMNRTILISDIERQLEVRINIFIACYFKFYLRENLLVDFLYYILLTEIFNLRVYLILKRLLFNILKIIGFNSIICRSFNILK